MQGDGALPKTAAMLRVRHGVWWTLFEVKRIVPVAGFIEYPHRLDVCAIWSDQDLAAVVPQVKRLLTPTACHAGPSLLLAGSRALFSFAVRVSLRDGALPVLLDAPRIIDARNAREVAVKRIR